MTKKFLIANWKMNPPSLEEAKKLFSGIKKKIPNSRKTEVVICPPFIFLSDLIKLGKTKKTIKFGAQNLFSEKKGSYTGEISGDSIKDIGGNFVIVGHSERRAMGESDETVNRKIRLALESGLKPIFCIGESDRDKDGDYLSFIQDEIKKGLKGVKLKDLKNIIVAYEPIWAIGKTEADAITPRLLQQMIIFIRKTLNEIYSHKSVLDVPIIYGGSAEPENAKGLLEEGTADGFLVGHASLEVDSFVEIFKTF